MDLIQDKTSKFGRKSTVQVTTKRKKPVKELDSRKDQQKYFSRRKDTIFNKVVPFLIIRQISKKIVADVVLLIDYCVYTLTSRNSL